MKNDNSDNDGDEKDGGGIGITNAYSYRRDPKTLREVPDLFSVMGESGELNFGGATATSRHILAVNIVDLDWS